MDFGTLEEKHLEKFWAEQLNALQAHQSYFLKPVELFQKDQIDTSEYLIPPSTCALLNKVSGDQQDARFILALTAFSITYARFSGLLDFIVASAATEQQHPMFYRFKASAEDSANELLERITEQWENVSQANDEALSAVLKRIAASREVDEQTCGMGFYTGVSEATGSGSLLVRFYLSCEQTNVRIRVKINTGRVDTGLVNAFCTSYSTVLHQLLTNVNQEIRKFDLLDDASVRAVMEDSRGQYQYAVSEHVMTLFDRCAGEHPDNLAVFSRSSKLAYRALQQQVNQLANYLVKSQGIRKNDRVAILLSRSERNIICMLALWRCGAWYVPIDHQLPAARLHYLLNDIDPKLVITEEVVLSQHIAINQPAVCFESIDLRHCETRATQELLAADDVAYIIYTSGSTGVPKGILQTHGMLFNLTYWQTHFTTLEHQLRHFQYTSFSFDVSIQEFCYFLTTGGTLFIAPQEMRLDFNRIREFILYHRIESVYFPYSVLNNFLHVNDHEAMEGHSLRHVITGSEQVIINANVEDFLRKNPEITLHDQYGPSETHVVTNFTLADTDGPILRRTPIGVPVANTSVFILDENMKLVPHGVAGELYISGANVAKGYWKLPDVAAKRFIEITLAHTTVKVYRTGDMGRRLPDGNIHYIGREDDQIKIKGFRVELGEIQKMLLAHEEVSDAAIVVINDDTGDTHLVAYFTASGDIATAELQSYVRANLPDYMVPSFFVEIETMPLTSNGKLNKNLLPNPLASVQRSTLYAKPETELQQQVFILWQEVLGIKNFGIDDNFFDLGGYSLKAVRLLGLLGKKFDVHLELINIYKDCTIRQLSEKIATAAEKGGTIVTAPAREFYPVSRGQYRLWVLDKMLAAGSAYTISTAFRVRGHLDMTLLQRAIQLVIIRHEILRTTFQEVDGEPVLKVDSWTPGDAYFEYHDHDGTVADETIERILAQRAARSFNLSVGPLVAIAADRLDISDVIITLTMHHIISDAWSLDNLLNEIITNYKELQHNEHFRPQPLRIQHKDYAVWQQSFLKSKDAEVHKDYWMKQIGREWQPLDVSLQARPALKTYRGEVVGGALPKETLTRLKNISSARGCSVFTSLMAFVHLFLAKRSGQTDIIVGMPVAGRHSGELIDQIGFFVNTLPVRTSINGSQRFYDYLDRVKAVMMEAFHHQLYPFDQLTQDLNLSPDPSRSPVFDVMINYQNLSELNRVGADDLSIEEIPVATHTSKFDLVFHFTENEDLHMAIEYNTDLFRKEEMARLFQQAEVLFQSITANPEKTLAEHHLLDNTEQSRQRKWNNTITDYPREQCVHSIFQQMSLQHQDSVAVVSGNRTITYGELAVLSDRVAGCLVQQHAVRPGDLVALMLERDETMIIAMLGVLKAGAAYVPILSDCPEDRLHFIVKETKARVVIGVAGKHAVPTLAFVDIKKAITEPPLRSAVPVSPDDLAYVMYTSGSTGTPKGVMINHRGIVRLVKDNNFTDFTKEDRVLQLSNYAFDAFTFEAYGALLNGASLYIYSSTDLSAAQLLSFVERNALSVGLIITSLFNYLVDESPKLVGHFRRLYIGGEACSWPHIKKAMAFTKGEGVLVNLYGPTEGTTVSTFQVIDEMAMEERTIPIGKPVSNTTAYVMDDRLCEQPVEVTGEICIGGDGLALGYLNQPELTRQKFCEHPATGERLYRTGDRGYWTTQGSLIFKGRNDSQLKIRGYRIECGEVEKALLAAGARQALVMPAEDAATRSQYLVAYASGIEKVDQSLFRERVRRELPFYMIPSVIQFTDELRLNTNGKIDRANLLPVLPEADSYAAPETPAQQDLASLWQGILGIKRVGIDDNFFELGGNSLSALKTISAMNRTHQDCKLTDLYNFPTIRKLTTRRLQATELVAPGKVETFDL